MLNVRLSSQEETCTIKSTNRRGNFSAKRYDCKMAGLLFYRLFSIRSLPLTCSLGGHMVPVPNCLSSVPHSQGWDLTQVRCSARFHVLIEDTWPVTWLFVSIFFFRLINVLFFFPLQRYQNSEHFPDQDWPHQAGRLWPGEEAGLWVFNGRDCKLGFPSQTGYDSANVNWMLHCG